MALNLGSLIVGLAGPVARKVLISLGIGTISYVGLQAGVNAAITAAQVSYNTTSGDLLGIVNLAGFGEAFGIILGGINARLGLMAMKRFGVITA